jgi:ADP-ribose pyrophosphatase YjhB (NUDIX family)
MYRNPLPVAAAVVLNEKREVLLIKRKQEPREGLWCLPMGFAELHETIGHAALRELREETWISGTVIRLLSADSMRIPPYGDLLVISFEIEKTGGQERPGDDAADLGYFATGHLPPLAFAANQRAIRSCLRAHREQWAIQDSFKRLSENTRESLLSDALVSLISNHAKQIAAEWLAEVTAHATTPSYAKADCKIIMERAVSALSQFSRWLSGNENDAEVASFYHALGAERKLMGFELPEVISSLSLLSGHIRTHATRRGVWKDAIDAYSAVEFVQRIVLFFDAATYHAVRGYLEGKPS